jgi:hypothetical protein
MQQNQDPKPLFTRFGAYEADFRRRGALRAIRAPAEKPLAALALLIEACEIVTHDGFRRHMSLSNIIVEFDRTSPQR